MRHRQAAVEHPGGIEVVEDRPAEAGIELLGEEDLQLQFVDVGDERQVMRPCKVAEAGQEVDGAALRRARRDRPVEARPWRRSERGADEGEELVDRRRVAGDERVEVLGKHIANAGKAVDGRSVADLEPQHAADPDLVIGGERGLDHRLRAGRRAEHVLHRGRAVPEILDRADQRPEPDLAGARLAGRRRNGERDPDLERDVLEHAAAEHVMGVVMAH